MDSVWISLVFIVRLKLLCRLRSGRSLADMFLSHHEKYDLPDIHKTVLANPSHEAKLEGKGRKISCRSCHNCAVLYKCT